MTPNAIAKWDWSFRRSETEFEYLIPFGVVPAKAGTHSQRRLGVSPVVLHRTDTAYASPPKGRLRPSSRATRADDT